MKKIIISLVFTAIFFNCIAQVKIADLPETTTFSNGYIPLTLNGVTYKVKAGNIGAVSISTVDSLKNTFGIATYSHSTVSDPARGGDFVARLAADGFTADSGLVFPSATSGIVWVRDLSQSQSVNVKWFGAKSDSVTDNLLKIQLAYSAASHIKMPLYFPRGYYKITYQNIGYVIRLVSNTGLIGDSATLFVSGQQTVSNVLNMFATISSTSANHVLVRGLNFVDCGISSLIWANNCTIENNNFIHSILYLQANCDGTTLGSNTHNAIINNNFEGINYKLSPNYHTDSIYRGAGGLQAATGAQSFGLRLSNIPYDIDPDLSVAPTQGNFDNLIEGNTFKNWSYNAVEFAGPNNKRNIVRNNTFDSCYGVCIDMDKGASFNTIESNYMKNTQPSEVFGRRDWVGPGPTDSVKGYVVLGDIEEQASGDNLPHNNSYRGNKFYNIYDYNCFRSQGSYNSTFEDNEYEVKSPTRGGFVLSANTNNAENLSNLPGIRLTNNKVGQISIGTTNTAGRFTDVIIEGGECYGITTTSTSTKTHLDFLQISNVKIFADSGTFDLSGQPKLFVFTDNTVTDHTTRQIHLSTAATDVDSNDVISQTISKNHFKVKSEILMQMNKNTVSDFTNNTLDSAYNDTTVGNAPYVFYFNGGRQNKITYNTFSNYNTTRLINYGGGDTLSNSKLYNNAAINGNTTTVLQNSGTKGYLQKSQNSWDADFAGPAAVSIDYNNLTNKPGITDVITKQDGLSDIGKVGMTGYTYSTSGTNYPAVSGVGLRVQRGFPLASTSGLGSFEFTCSANNDSALYFQKFITSAGASTGFRRIVTVSGTTSFTAGMIPIWSGGAFKAATITAGSGVTVTNANGAITIAATTTSSAVEYGGTYSDAIAWTATTAPSGTTNHTWSATQIGKMVTVNIKLQYSVAGSAVTGVTMVLPSALPAPATPTGYTTNDFIYPGYGGCKTSTGSTVSTNQRVGLQLLSSSWKVSVITTSQATTDVQVTFTYWTP